jgi:hypothetical protein
MLGSRDKINTVDRAKNDASLAPRATLDMDYRQLLRFLLSGRFRYSFSHEYILVLILSYDSTFPSATFIRGIREIRGKSFESSTGDELQRILG